MGFIMHFYIIFGTNLLTESPVQIPFFCLFQCFAEKEYQTEQNLCEDLSWNKRNPGDLEWTSRKQRGGHEVGGRAQGGRRPPPSWAPRGSTDLLLSPIYTVIPWKHPGEPRNHFCTTATFCTHEIPSGDLFRRSAGGGFDDGGLLHQHHSLSDDVWVVYHIPSGP